MRESRTCLIQFATMTIAATLLLLAGCAQPQSKNGSALSGEEREYIDLKRNISITVPATWTRIKLPVSSPEYRADSILWNIPTVTGSGFFQVRNFTGTTPEEALASFLEQEGNDEVNLPLAYQLKAGPAVRLDNPLDDNHFVYVAIHISGGSYVLACSVPTNEFDNLSSTINKVISSLRSL